MHFNYHVLSDSISILIAISHRIVEFHAHRKEEDWRKEWSARDTIRYIRVNIIRVGQVCRLQLCVNMYVRVEMTKPKEKMRRG